MPKSNSTVFGAALYHSERRLLH